MKKISNTIQQFFTTLGCVIKDPLTYLLYTCLSLAVNIMIWIPAHAYVADKMDEWFERQADNIYSSAIYAANYSKNIMSGFTTADLNMDEFAEMYLIHLRLFESLFIRANICVIVLTMVFMFTLHKRKKGL